VLPSATVSFPAYTVMPVQSLTQILVSHQGILIIFILNSHTSCCLKGGDSNSYPFDSYSVEYPILSYILPTHGPLPLTILSQGTPQGFTVDAVFADLTGDSDGSQVMMTITVNRSPITILFSCIIFTCGHQSTRQNLR
jgi:hypothetical protein